MDNNFFILKLSGDSKVIGPNYPQVITTDEPHNISIKKIYSARNVLPDLDIKLPNLILRSKAKVTDFISTSFQTMHGFFISERVKNIVNRFQHTELSFFPCELLTAKDSLPYYWMHLTSNVSAGSSIPALLDYPNTYFFVGDAIQREIRKIQIHSLDDYLKTKEEIMRKSDNEELVWIKEPAFKNEIMNYDLFTLQPFSTRCFISGRLSKAFEEENISGVLMTPAAFRLV